MCVPLSATGFFYIIIYHAFLDGFKILTYYSYFFPRFIFFYPDMQTCLLHFHVYFKIPIVCVDFPCLL